MAEGKKYAETTGEVTLHVLRSAEPYRSDGGQDLWDVESVTVPPGTVVDLDHLAPYQRDAAIKGTEEGAHRSHRHTARLLKVLKGDEHRDASSRVVNLADAVGDQDDPMRAFRSPHPESPTAAGDAYTPPIGTVEGYAEPVRRDGGGDEEKGGTSGVLDGKVGEIKDHVATVSDEAELESLETAEKAGDNRKGVLDAIAARREELADESKDEDKDEEGSK